MIWIMDVGDEEEGVGEEEVVAVLCISFLMLRGNFE